MTSQRTHTTFKEIAEETRHESAKTLFRKAQIASRLAKTVRRGRRRLYQVKHIALAEALRIAPDLFHVSIDTRHHVGLDLIVLDARNALHTHPSWIRDSMKHSA